MGPPAAGMWEGAGHAAFGGIPLADRMRGIRPGHRGDAPSSNCTSEGLASQGKLPAGDQRAKLSPSPASSPFGGKTARGASRDGSTGDPRASSENTGDPPHALGLETSARFRMRPWQVLGDLLTSAVSHVPQQSCPSVFRSLHCGEGGAISNNIKAASGSTGLAGPVCSIWRCSNNGTLV